MDPITAVITVAGGIQTVFTFATALKGYVDDTKSAKEDVKSLARTIESTFRAIEELEELLVENETTGSWNEFGTKRARGCIQDGYFIVSKLSQILLKSGTKLDDNVAENIDGKVFSVLMWPYYKPQVRELMTELILLKIDVNTAHTTYKAPNWTAAEAAKGKQMLKKYQQSRKIFMEQLQGLKEARRKADKKTCDDRDSSPSTLPSTDRSASTSTGSDSDSRASSDDRSARRRFKKAEQRIFSEWEEAVTERIRIEEQLKVDEAAALKQRDQKIRDDYVKKIKSDAAKRQVELDVKRSELDDMFKDRDIPPKDKQEIIETAIQTLHPVMQDSEMVLALLNQPSLSKQPPTLPMMPAEGSGKSMALDRSTSKAWLTRRPAAPSRNAVDPSTPLLMRDDTAPGGLAVLYAAHFTPDPYGQYRGIEIDSRALWNKCSAKATKKSDELTADFIYLPENCKSAILKLLEDLSVMSKDYTWKMLLVYEARGKARKRLFGLLTSSHNRDDVTGIFVIFKRHLRQHRDLTYRFGDADHPTAVPSHGEPDVAQSVLDHKSTNFPSQPHASNTQGMNDAAPPAGGNDSTKPDSKDKPQKDPQSKDETQPFEYIISPAEKPDGVVCWRIQSEDPQLRSYFSSRKSDWSVDHNSANAVFITTDTSMEDLIKLIKQEQAARNPTARGETLPLPIITLRFDNPVLLGKMNLSRSKKRLRSLSKRIARGDVDRYDDSSDDDRKDEYSDRDSYDEEGPRDRSRERSRERFVKFGDRHYRNADRDVSEDSSRRSYERIKKSRKRDGGRHSYREGRGRSSIHIYDHYGKGARESGRQRSRSRGRSFSPEPIVIRESASPYPGIPHRSRADRYEAYDGLPPLDTSNIDSQHPPIRFTDAVSRKFTFPWRNCQTWRGMEDLIKQAFENVEVIGEHVRQGHYDLIGPEEEIILPSIWTSLVRPGMHIKMAMWPLSDTGQPPNPVFLAPDSMAQVIPRHGSDQWSPPPFEKRRTYRDDHPASRNNVIVLKRDPVSGYLDYPHERDYTRRRRSSTSSSDRRLRKETTRTGYDYVRPPRARGRTGRAQEGKRNEGGIVEVWDVEPEDDYKKKKLEKLKREQALDAEIAKVEGELKRREEERLGEESIRRRKQEMMDQARAKHDFEIAQRREKEMKEREKYELEKAKAQLEYEVAKKREEDKKLEFEKRMKLEEEKKLFEAKLELAKKEEELKQRIMMQRLAELEEGRRGRTRTRSRPSSRSRPPPPPPPPPPPIRDYDAEHCYPPSPPAHASPLSKRYVKICQLNRVKANLLSSRDRERSLLRRVGEIKIARGVHIINRQSKKHSDPLKVFRDAGIMPRESSSDGSPSDFQRFEFLEDSDNELKSDSAGFVIDQWTSKAPGEAASKKTSSNAAKKTAKSNKPHSQDKADAASRSASADGTTRKSDKPLPPNLEDAEDAEPGSAETP